MCAARHAAWKRPYSVRPRQPPITNLYSRLTTLYAAAPAQRIEFVSTPEARSRIWGRTSVSLGSPPRFSHPGPRGHAFRSQQCVAVLPGERRFWSQPVAADLVHCRPAGRPGRVRICLLSADALMVEHYSWRWRAQAFSTTSATATSGESVTSRECLACKKALSSAART